MLRPLLAALVALTAFAAVAPSGSAVGICSNQLDPTDLVVGDDPLVKSHCTTENLISYDCDVDAQVNHDGTVTRSARCDPLIDCVTHPCPGPFLAAEPAASSQPLPCSVAVGPAGDLSATCSVAMCEVGPVVEGGKYDHAVSCESFLYCVTEPCPGSGRIEI